jgi:DNA-binding response OmpR family regulator
MANILVVEDDVTLRDAYNIVFSKRGHSVHTAKDGEEALQLCKTIVFEVIVLDIMLPKVSGFEFLKAFEPKKHPGTKVIVVSNLNSAETSKEVIQLGALKALYKAHLSPEELAIQIETVVRES